jgi:hypothetical protein
MLKKVFNWSEVHLSEVTSYKIHTLVNPPERKLAKRTSVHYQKRRGTYEKRSIMKFSTELMGVREFKLIT